LRLSAFRLRFFFRCFRSFRPSSVPKLRFANASTGICLLQLRMERRMKSVATVHVSDCHRLSAEMRSEKATLFSSPRARGEVASRASG